MFNDSHPFCSGCQFYFPTSLIFSLRNTDFPHSPLFNIFFFVFQFLCVFSSPVLSLYFSFILSPSSFPSVICLAECELERRVCVFCDSVWCSFWSLWVFEAALHQIPYTASKAPLSLCICVWGGADALIFPHTCCINMRKTHAYTQEFSACTSSQDRSSARCTLSHLQVCAWMTSVYSAAAAAAAAETLGLSLLHYRWGSCEQHVCFLN